MDQDLRQRLDNSAPVPVMVAEPDNVQPDAVAFAKDSVTEMARAFDATRPTTEPNAVARGKRQQAV